MSESLNKKQEKNMKRNKKILVKIFILFLFFVIIAGIGIKLYHDNQSLPVSLEKGKDITVEIPEGSSTEAIAQILKSNNIIRNKYIFKIIVKLQNNEGKMKAGKYLLNTGMTPEEIIEKLVKGDAVKETITFTIPEGYELRQIADRLSRQGLVNKERFLELSSNPSLFNSKYKFLEQLPKGATLEGFLFPDTYEVYSSASEEQIITKMLDRFNEIFTEEIINKGKNLNLDLNQIVTLASIIEREGKIDSERPLISAVFHNRLKKGMLLQSCATVQFALGERKNELTYEDLEVESEYNTYIHKGLPPGPIASPGKKSIEAAVNPADVNYIYFVANGDGSHTFTDDYNEFLRAKHSE